MSTTSNQKREPKPLKLNFVPIKIGGSFALRGRPGARTVARIANLTVCTHFLTLQGPKEKPELVGDWCKESNLKWIWHSMPNGNPPEATEYDAIKETLDKVVVELKGGANIMIHCAAGMHRTGMISNLLLRYVGYSADEALAMITESRPITATAVLQHRLDFADTFIKAKGTYQDK